MNIIIVAKRQQLLCCVVVLALLMGQISFNYVKSEERIIDSGSCGEDAIYTTIEYENDKYELVISGTGETADYEGVNGTPKRTPWANYCSRIKKIIIENGITKIGNDNFHGCKIESITLPDTLREIGERAFGHSGNIENLVIPEGVEIIQDEGFYMIKSIKSVVLPSTLKYLGENAFCSCKALELVTFLGDTEILDQAFCGCSNLREVNMIGNVTRNEHTKDEFLGCSSLENICLSDTYSWEGSTWGPGDSFPESLKNIDVKESNQYYTVVDGILYTKDKKELVYCLPEKQIKEYEIPDSTEVIRSGAFYGNKKLEYIYMPDSVKKIGAAAFKGASALKYAVISNSVSSIPESVFPDTEGLSIYVPESVTETKFNEGMVLNDSFGCGVGEREIHIYGEEDSYIAKTYADIFKKAIYADFIVDGGLIKRKVLFPDYKYGTLPKIVEGDKKFLGWYTEENGGRKISPTDLFAGDSSIKLYAHWDNEADNTTQPSETSIPSISVSSGSGIEPSAVPTTKPEPGIPAPTAPVRVSPVVGSDVKPSTSAVTSEEDERRQTEEKSNTENSLLTVGSTNNVKKPGKVKNVSAVKKKKALRIKWKKVSGATGYQICYSNFSNFKKKNTKVTKNTTIILKNLKTRKKYYVKVRAYIIKNGKRVYGKYSKVEKKKTK